MTTSRYWIFGLLCAIAFAFLWSWDYITSREDLATQRNAFIEGEIEKLNRQVVEVKDVGEIVTVYDAMARAANEVQQRRTVYAAEALAELSRLPRQIVLASVTVEKNRLTLIGEAASESALERLKPTLEQGRFITKARIEESVPLADKRRFRLEAEIAGPSSSPSRPVEKQ